MVVETDGGGDDTASQKVSWEMEGKWEGTHNIPTVNKADKPIFRDRGMFKLQMTPCGRSRIKRSEMTQMTAPDTFTERKSMHLPSIIVLSQNFARGLQENMIRKVKVM